MEPASESWQDELQMYFRSVERLTGKSLKRIKQDRARNHLPFDEPFMKYFLNRTNSRIAHVYVDLMYEDHSEKEVSQQSYGNAGTSSQQQQLTSTIIGPESIEQLPTILIQSSNGNLVPNTSASTSLVRDDSQISNEIVISIPSDQVQPDPSKVESNHSTDQETLGQSNDRIVVDAEPKKRNDKMGEPEIGSNSNKDNKSTTTSLTISGADRSKYEEPFRQMTNSHKLLQSETIDLTSDQEDAADILDSDQNIDGQTEPKDRQRKAYGASAAGHSKEMERFRISLRGGNISQNNNYRAAQPAEPNTSKNQIDRNYKQQSTGTNDISNHETFNDNLGESSTYRAAAKLPEKYQLEPAVPPGTNREANSDKMSSGGTNERDSKYMQDDANASATVEEISNVRLSKNRSGVSRDIGDFAGLSQPMIHRRKRGNGDVMIKAHVKDRLKLASTAKTVKRHKCDYCEYSTDLKKDLTRHIRTHTGERPYRCEVCERKFSQKQSLNTHMKAHRELFQFQCSNCRLGFSDEMKWKSHQIRCKAKGFECFLCKKIFLAKQSLFGHMHAHTGERLRCSICRKQFCTDCGLARHMKSHGKLFRHQCSNCRQGFSKKKTWELHESRCKSKQFECYLCNKKFNERKSHLLEHMRHKHTGEKPFGCSGCPKRFYKKYHLTYHSKRCHSKDK